MHKSRAIRAATRQRKWCENHQCFECPFNDSIDRCGCILIERGILSCERPVMSFDDDCNMIATELQQEMEDDDAQA